MDIQKIDFSILELAVVSQGQSIKQTLDNSLTLAKAAEEFGYTRFWFAEHHNSEYIASNAPSLLIGYVAENTKTIRVGSGGIMLPNHSPIIVAEQFGTLGHLYHNRIDLGLGRAPGTDQLTARAIRSDFMTAAHSFPAEVSQIQNYFSEHNNTSAVRATIAEGTNVPLYILGSSTDSAHLAAAEGLPYAFASHFAPARLMDALKIYREEFRASGIIEKPYTIAGVNVIVADTDQEAERLFTTLVRMFIGVLTGSRNALQPPVDMTEDLRQTLNHPTLAQMLKCSFVGRKETVKNQIKKFLDQTKVNELIVAAPMYDLNDRIKSIRLFSEVMADLNQNFI